MPQINRIRVNNVKYNFGTQFYDDFIMRFNCSNTIYDLANGGGKSLLMLLLLQNVIPNCTLDDKQPIEKLFRPGGGNTVIHSLVEWKLDACYQKDNYKYMTTGFCARRAKAAGDEDDGAVRSGSGANYGASGLSAGDQSGAEGLLSGAEGIAALSQGSGAFGGNTSVEYFNYCIFYREFGDNDIKNLPLVSNGERITYNGLKVYLRELEKKDFGVSVYIFDRKGDYQNFISQYGIFESQWEIIRGINKTEGHVRTYFETNYRTSRKVVEDLLIEEIIQKSFNNKLGVDNDEGKMAQTLLDIKDKLLELSKKHARINAYDSQMSAIDNFADYVNTFVEFYNRKEELENQLFQWLVACKQEIIAQEKAQTSLENLLEKMQQEMVSEQRGIQTAEVISEQKSLMDIKAMADESCKSLEASDRQLAELKSKLTQMESANDYADYANYLKELTTVSETINNRMREKGDIIAELKAIANLIKDDNDLKEASITDRLKVAENSVKRNEAVLEEAKTALEEARKNYTVKSSFVAFTEQEIAGEEKQLAALMEKAGLIVAENAEAEIEAVNEQIVHEKCMLDEESRRYEEISGKLSQCNADISGLAVRNEILRQELDRAQEAAGRQTQDVERLESLQKVYNAVGCKELSEQIITIYRKMEREYHQIEKEYNHLQKYIDKAKNGSYTFDNPLRDKLKEYLESRYGEDVVEGHEWFKTLNNGQKRDVFKRAPFVEYSFIIKNDFERIKEDAALLNFERGAFAIPVISEQILYDTKLEVNKELVAFAMKDMAFLRDEARLEAELAVAGEELENLRLKMEKQEDRKQVVWEDYIFVTEQNAVISQGQLADSDKIKSQLEANSENWAELEQSAKRHAKDIEEMQAKVEDRKDKLAECRHRLEILNMTKENRDRLSQKYDSLKEGRETAKQASDEAAGALLAVSEAERAYSVSNELYANAAEALAALKNDWENNYQFYAEGEAAQESSMETTSAAFEKALKGLDRDRLESRFFGLKAVLDKENVDVADKEALMNHYRASMEKCKNAIEYRGSSFENIKNGFEEGVISKSEPVELQNVKAQISKIKEASKTQREELDAQNALMNRLEGSIAHGINQIEEKYGAFEPFECENPENFMRRHKELIKKLGDNIKEVQAKHQRGVKNLKDIYVVEKDLERIVSGAGMTIPEIAAGEVGNDAVPGEAVGAGVTFKPEDITAYESISKEYDKHMKLAYRKRDEYDKQKQKLMDLLMGFDAGELAGEIRTSVKMPESRNETQQLAERLKETNTFIQLEKDRVAKGIEDMERIKDNFENRCIQTCSNIKAELDRLTKLSNITLDDEVISIIGLYIPYIKEELYKERMSSYIDETIIIAESFKSVEERLKYIRNRLTWKRMFSVIVTDMNGVRIDLYKRERIKDQSRYLKYEEAVGSTGQSQGIYIQFLIAIINYISSINAESKDAALIGKTIFIDNPFGAAKDIYIWEPIFRLLKTNHVQLIVPARGATPAITGRFDVNYILGQKLVDKRQQTVVVDYYSKTNQNRMEYTRMDYEQASFEFPM